LVGAGDVGAIGCRRWWKKRCRKRKTRRRRSGDKIVFGRSTIDEIKSTPSPLFISANVARDVSGDVVVETVDSSTVRNNLIAASAATGSSSSAPLLPPSPAT